MTLLGIVAFVAHFSLGYVVRRHVQRGLDHPQVWLWLLAAIATLFEVIRFGGSL